MKISAKMSSKKGYTKLPTVVDDNVETNTQNSVPEKKPSVVIGDTTVIPNDNTARLMYYLHCVKNCVDVDISSRLVDYKNFRLLSDIERRDVVIYAHRFRPGVLRKVIFFEVEEDNYLLPNATNNFLAFDDPVVIGSFNLTSNVILVDGVQFIIKRVMIFKYSWLHDYFVVPFSDEKWRIGLAPKPTYLVGVTSKNHPSDAADVPLWCISGVLCCFVFPPLGLALLAVGACRAGQESARPKQSEKTTTYVVY